jgi:NTE family protein
MFLERAARFAFGGGAARRGPEIIEPAPSKPSPPPTKIGLALGGGAARGWAHIGVLRALEENGVVASVIAGTSIGAVVGGCYSADRLATIEDFATSLTRRRVVGLLDFRLRGSGIIRGEKLRRLLDANFGDAAIEKLRHRFCAIATEISTGHEIWLTHGALVPAMRASYSLPGIFDPVRVGGRWLMDGALVNPVPVTAARALGADVVIAVNLGGETFGRGTVIPAHGSSDEDRGDEAAAKSGNERTLLAQMGSAASRINPFRRRSNPAVDGPRMATVMIEAFNITQDRISRARLAGDPPDVTISPAVGRIGLFEFHRAGEAIAAGYEAAQRAIPRIRETMAALQANAAA